MILSNQEEKPKIRRQRYATKTKGQDGNTPAVHHSHLLRMTLTTQHDTLRRTTQQQNLSRGPTNLSGVAKSPSQRPTVNGVGGDFLWD
jgi:hypothetical protein